MTMKKAIILARVSTKEQEDQGLSIPAQVERLLGYAKSKGYDNPEIHELAESSTKDTRKKFEAIIAEIRKAKEPYALFVDTVDRLQRSFRESVELDDLRRQGKLDVHFYREKLCLSINSNSSELIFWDMSVMMAKSYVYQLSDNVKRSNEKKIANGEWPGQAPP